MSRIESLHGNMVKGPSRMLVADITTLTIRKLRMDCKH